LNLEFAGNFLNVSFVHLKTVGWFSEVAPPCKPESKKSVASVWHGGNRP